MSMREIDAVEQQANRMVDEISKAQESLKVLTEVSVDFNVYLTAHVAIKQSFGTLRNPN